MATLVPAVGTKALGLFTWPANEGLAAVAPTHWFPIFSENVTEGDPGSYLREERGRGPGRRVDGPRLATGGMSVPTLYGTNLVRLLLSYCPFTHADTVAGAEHSHALTLPREPWTIRRNNLHFYRGDTANTVWTYPGFVAQRLTLTQQERAAAMLTLRGFGYEETQQAYSTPYTNARDVGFANYTQFALTVNSSAVSCKSFKADVSFALKPHFPAELRHYDRVLEVGGVHVDLAWVWEEDDSTWVDWGRLQAGTALDVAATWTGPVAGWGTNTITLAIKPAYLTRATPTVGGRRVIQAQRSLTGVLDPDTAGYHGFDVTVVSGSAT